MSSTKIIPRNHFCCSIEGHGDFIRPTDISYKKYPSNNVKRPIRPPCKKGRRNVISLKNSSVKQIQRTSSCQNLSEIQNKDHGLCKNSKSCENITFIGKQLSISLRRKPQAKIMKGAEDEPQASPASAEGDSQKGSLDKSQEEEVIMREALTNFIINAWRNQGKETAKLKKENDLLKKQESELVLVKQQLEDEREKSTNLNIEIMQHRLIKVNAMRKIEKLKCVSFQQQQEIDDCKSRMDAKQIEYENSKNKCLEFENEAASLKKELNAEREQKRRLQEEEKKLIEKVRSLQLAASEKDAALEEEMRKLKRDIAAKEWELERHRSVIGDMEMFLTAKEENIAAIKKVSDAYMMEVTKMRLSGGEAPNSKANDDNWSSASNVVRTAVFFMLPLMKKLIFP